MNFINTIISTLSISLYLTLFTVVTCKPVSIYDNNNDGPGTVTNVGINRQTTVSGCTGDNSTYTAFISYRRSTSKHLAMLLKVLLQKENVSTFLDVDDLQAGHWDNQLTEAIRASPNFIFILSNGSLDRCIGDVNYTDVIHQEIKTAVNFKRNIIPIFDDFIMPADKFSPVIREMLKFQGVEWNHCCVNGSIKRLLSYFICRSTDKIKNKS